MKNITPSVPGYRKPLFQTLVAAVALASLQALSPFASQSASAATIEEIGATGAVLSSGTSWTGGLAPGTVDTALFDSGDAGGSFTLGAPVSWYGLKVGSSVTGNPSGAVTISNDGNTLSLGAGGIDLSAATVNLTISSGLTISGGQTWNVASGRTLTLNTGTFTRSAGATLTVSGGAGTIASSMTNLSANTNGILAPWATVSSPGSAAADNSAGYTYATISGGDIVPFTGATLATNTTGAWGGIGSGTTTSANYDISGNASVATPSQTGLLREVGTLRFTGAGWNQEGNTATTLMEANAILNAGSGELYLGSNGGTVYTVGAATTGQLVLAAESSPISIAQVGNGVSSSGTLTTTGTAGVIITGVASYTGPTYVDGVTSVPGSGNINTTSGITINGPSASLTYTSSVAETKAITVSAGTLNGSGVMGAVTVASSPFTKLANGNGGTTALTLSSLTFSGTSTLQLDLLGGANTTTVPLSVTGALVTSDTGTGEITLNLVPSSGFLNGDDYNLVAFGGGITGSSADFAIGTGLGARQLASTLAISGSYLQLDVVGDSLVWTGTATNNGVTPGQWVTAQTSSATSATPEWVLKGAHTTTDFWAGDIVEFDDTANDGGSSVVPSTSVVITGSSVTPQSITFNNNVLNYTVSSDGSHGITGSTPVTLNGSGSVTVTSTNTYTGATTVNAGTLNLSSGGSVNSSAVSVASGATLNEDALSTIGGSASLSNSGSTTLAGVNSYTGATSVVSGTLAVSGTLGNTAIGVTGGTLSLQDAGAVSQNTITVSSTGSLATTANNAIAGSASLTVSSSSASVVLSNSNSYTGATLINGGVNTTVLVTAANGAGSGEFNLATGATTPVIQLHVNGGGTIPFANAFGGNSNVGAETVDVNNDGDSSTGGVIELLGTNGNWGTSDTLNITGGNGYSLYLANISTAAGFAGSETLNPTSASVSLGSYHDGSGQAVSLVLSGTANGNSVANIGNGGVALPLIQNGTGTWTVSGTNTYTGATIAGAGTMIVTGSNTATPSVTGSAGSILEVDGSLNVAATITSAGTVEGQGTVGAIIMTNAAGGNLAAGLSLEDAAAGVLTSDSNVTLASTGTFSIRLGVAVPSDNDELAIANSNTVTLGSADLVLNLGSAFTPQPVGTDYVIIDGENGNAVISGAFAQGATITDADGDVYSINYNVNSTDTGSGDDVVLQETTQGAVPEPGTYGMIFGGIGMLCFWRKLRRASRA